MASAGDIRAGGAYVEITAEDSKLEGALKHAETKCQEFQKKLDGFSVGVGAALTAAFLGAKSAIEGLFGSLIESGDKFDKMSQRIGVSVESLSQLDKMASMCGTDMGSVETAIAKMSKKLGEAQRGVASSAEQFTRLGLSVGELSAMKPEEQFFKIAEAISGLSDQSSRTAAAMSMFEEAGTKFFPLFNQGADGIQNMKSRLDELGIGMSTQTASSLATLGDNLFLLKSTFVSLGAKLLEGFVPAITKSAEVFATMVGKVSTFISNHRVLVGTVTAAIAAFGACTAAMITWQLATGKLSAALKVLSAALKMVSMNPWMLAIVAVTAAIGGLIAMMSKAKKEMVNFSDEASKLTEQHKAQMGVDKNLMNRLEELANKTNKSASEMAEAETIVGQLTDTYGDLGISIDKATGKIEGMTDAQKKLAQAQMDIKKADLKAEIAEKERNINAADKQYEAALKEGKFQNERKVMFSADMGSISYDNGRNWQKVSEGKKVVKNADGSHSLISSDIAEQKAKADSERESLKSRQDYLNALENGVDLEAIEQGGAGTVTVDTGLTDKEASLNKDFAERGMSEADKQRQKANAKREQDLADAAALRDQRMAAGDDNAESLYNDAVSKIETIYNETMTGIADAEQKKADEEKKKAESESQANADRLNNSAVSDYERQSESLKSAMRDAWKEWQGGDKKAGKTYADLSAQLDKLNYDNVTKSLTDADARFKEAQANLDKAEKTGTDEEKIKAREEWKAARAALNEAVAAKDSYDSEKKRNEEESSRTREEAQRKIEEQNKRSMEYNKERAAILSQSIQDGMKESFSAKGTFSAFEAANAQNPVQKKIQAASEMTAALNKKMLTQLEELNDKYSTGYTA